MTSTHKTITELVHQLVRDKEGELGHRLCIEDFDFITQTCVELVTSNIHKFVAGSKEHGEGCFVADVDHLAELYNEQLDSINYLAAARHNKRKHDRRY